MLHELLSSLDDEQVSNDSSQALEENSDNKENESTLLVNSTTYKDVSLADIRKLLSTLSKNKPPDKTTEKKRISTNESKSKKKSNLDDEITINSKTY